MRENSMTGPKTIVTTPEPQIELTVNNQGAQQAFQNYVAGVAQAFREKHAPRSRSLGAADPKLTNR
jgi:hypothetical protein